MSRLGIFLGLRFVHALQVKGRKVLTELQVDRQKLTSGSLEEKVPEEVKLVAMLKDEFRRARLVAQEAALALSGRDIIIRTFEMPLLPNEELKGAINFEAKKHIPFKIEELVTDFQIKLDKRNRRYLVLFAAIRKDLLNSYLSVFSQLNIQLRYLEYSAFSLLRLLKLSGVNEAGIVGLVSVGCLESDEVNFTVLEDGFPLFSRDISITEASGQPDSGAGPDISMLLEKLKTELRISLDFYHRKFLNKLIKNLVFFASPECRKELEVFSQDIGLQPQFLDPGRFIRKDQAFNLGLFKAYSVGLARVVKSPVELNLLAARQQAKAPSKTQDLSALFSDIVIDFRILVVGVIICLVVAGFGLKRILPVQQELQEIIASRPEVTTVSPEAGLEEITSVDGDYRNKISTLETLVKKQLYLTEVFDVLPRILPDGVRLTDFKFQNQELLLEGVAYQADRAKELELVNLFFANLKNNSIINKYFKQAAVVSINQKEIEGAVMTVFVFSCRKNN